MRFVASLVTSGSVPPSSSVEYPSRYHSTTLPCISCNCQAFASLRMCLEPAVFTIPSTEVPSRIGASRGWCRLRAAAHRPYLVSILTCGGWTRRRPFRHPRIAFGVDDREHPVKPLLGRSEERRRAAGPRRPLHGTGCCARRIARRWSYFFSRGIGRRSNLARSTRMTTTRFAMFTRASPTLRMLTIFSGLLT